jgi:hypothetical protein
MDIKNYITAHLNQKLKKRQVLVIYDHEKRYHEIALSLASEKVKVFDVTQSAILAKENATEYFSTKLHNDDSARMVIYLPFEVPANKQERIRDPFAVFSAFGAIFPAHPEDRYIELCKACFPNKEQQIDELFKNEQPVFETINNLDSGTKWVKLETVTGGKSAKEIITNLLFPTDGQKSVFQKDNTWHKEWQSFAKDVIDLQSSAQELEGIQDEIWKHLLYSEFILICLSKFLRN